MEVRRSPTVPRLPLTTPGKGLRTVADDDRSLLLSAGGKRTNPPAQRRHPAFAAVWTSPPCSDRPLRALGNNNNDTNGYNIPHTTEPPPTGNPDRVRRVLTDASPMRRSIDSIGLVEAAASNVQVASIAASTSNRHSPEPGEQLCQFCADFETLAPPVILLGMKHTVCFEYIHR